MLRDDSASVSADTQKKEKGEGDSVVEVIVRVVSTWESISRKYVLVGFTGLSTCPRSAGSLEIVELNVLRHEPG